MTYEIDESCTGCGMCLSICPVGAVSGGPGKQHSVNGDLCIGCGACARVCADSCVSDPSGNRLIVTEYNHFTIREILID